MKRTLPLLLLLVSSLFTNLYSQEDRAYFELVQHTNESKDNGIIYAGNGDYLITPNPSYTWIVPGIIPNMLRINPVKSIYNDTFISGIFRREFQQGVNHKYPLYHYQEISKKEYDDILENAVADNKWGVSVEKLKEQNNLKFQDISDADKKRRALQYNASLMMAERKADSITNIRRRKLLLDLIKTPVVRLSGSDNLPIPDPKYYKGMDYFEAFPEKLDSVRRAHVEFRDLMQATVNEILTPFYMAKSEVTNGDYREFIRFISDSINLHYSYWNVHSDSLSMTLLNCSKKERDSLDPKQMNENIKAFGLKNSFKSMSAFIHDESWSQVLDTLYDKTISAQFIIRKELLLYPNKKGRVIAVYPDSLGFKPLSECLSDETMSRYNWSPKFNESPVLNLNFYQIEAYCAWKENQLKEKYRKQGYTIKVSLPTVADYEFAMKALVPNEVNSTVIDQSNKSFVANDTDCKSIKLHFESRKQDLLSVIIKDDMSVEAFKYNQWLSANSTKNLDFINGNAAEYCATPVTKQLLSYYGIPSPRGPLSAYTFVLGSSYAKDVLSKNGTAYTKIFYKSIQEKSTVSCFNGFRLVYKFVPLQKD